MRSLVRRKRRRHYQSVAANVGISPGTITIDPEAPKPVVKVISFTPDHYSEEIVDNLETLAAIVQKWPTSWIQVIGLGDKATIQRLGEIFSLHRLTLEDITNVQQRPKFEQYGDQFFIVSRLSESLDDATGSQQVAMIVERRFVISFQERVTPVFEPLLERIRNKLGRVRHSHADYLCYAILDCVIDQYFPVLEMVAEELDAVETNMFSMGRAKMLAALHNLRHDLLTMRRAMWPLRDVINMMLRETHPLFTQETKIHLRDCYDHSVQIVDLVESYRELSASLMELSLSLMSHRLNEGIRILTVISTIFIPLNFIAGVYGMNFHPDVSEWNMPELTWKYGYLFALGVMLVVTAGQMFFFWRKGWLNSNTISK